MAKSEAEATANELAKKKISVMDHMINMHRKWRKKPSKCKGVVEFEECWKVLTTFAQAEPVVNIETTLVWNDYMEYQVSVMTHSAFTCHMSWVVYCVTGDSSLLLLIPRILSLAQHSCMTCKVAKAGVSAQCSFVGDVQRRLLAERLRLQESEVEEVQRRLLRDCWFQLGVACSCASFFPSLVLAPKVFA